MRVKYSTMSQTISMDKSTVNLSRTSIHDAYALKFNIRLLNETGEAVTPNIKSILDAITDISLISDSTRIHYSITGFDLALLNARVQKVQTTNVLWRTFEELADDAALDVEFTLYLDEGDIVAVAHSNLELRGQFATKTSQKLTITNATCTVTVIEKLCTQAELFAKYGEDLRAVAEPKVYGITETVSASTEFLGFLDIPTTTLLKGAIVYFENDSNTMPVETGLLRTVPDRVELAKIDYATHRALDEIIYQTKFPEGVLNWNYGTQWQDNGVGKDGWSFSRSDVMLAAKTTVPTKVRYVSIESMVDTALYKSNFRFTEY